MTKLLDVPIEHDIVSPSGKIVGVHKKFVADPNQDFPRLRGIWKTRKFDISTHAAWLAGDPAALPWEEVELENSFLTVGITELLSLFIGAKTGVANGANLQIGMGDNSTAFAAAQTGLQAPTNFFWQYPDTGYPFVSNAVLNVQATIGAGNANFAWNEMGLRLFGDLVGINRVVASQGTKTSASIWVASVTISPS
jgi:hypothetical protein